MNKKWIKSSGSLFIVGLFIFFAFASNDDKKNESTSGSDTETFQNENNEEPKDEECYKCNGFGQYTPKAPGGFVNKTRQCEVCNGTGKSSN